jgi:hypothetical protein
MDTHLHSAQIRVERKFLTLDLKENPSGTFLRITEESHSGHHNSIVIPATGLELFRDALNEVITFNKTVVGNRAILSLGQLKAESPALGGSADLRIGS